MNPTDEQQTIINKLEYSNVYVDCTVGSGKTSTIIFVAEHYKNLKVLLLTYNKRLKLETRTRSTSENLEIHTYHSFCVTYYSKECHNDFGLLDIIQNKREPLRKFSYDIVMIDEAQDMNPLYYEISCKIIKESGPGSGPGPGPPGPNRSEKPTLCVIGDRYQSIYGYNNADSRYIQLAPKLFNFNDRQWSECTLSETFRLTDKITNFVNEITSGVTNRLQIKTNKKSDKKVRYLICDQFSKHVLEEILEYRKNGYKYSDIFILGPSIRNDKSPMKMLANRLTSKGIPIYCPTSDQEALDNEITLGKIVFCTFHQVKGLERKVSIVYNFDDSYFKYYNKDAKQNELPNELYVAITRSLECLTVIHHYKNGFLSIIDENELYNNCNVIVKRRLSNDFDITGAAHKIQTISVSDLIRHLPINVLEEAISLIDIQKLSNKSKFIEIPTKISQIFNGNEIFENVSDINGIAIPSYFEYLKTGMMSIEQCNVRDPFKNIKFIETKPELIQRPIFEELLFRDEEPVIRHSNTHNATTNETNTEIDVNDNSDMNTQKLLFLSNKYSSIKNGYSFKMNQISSYSWLYQSDLDQCISRLSEQIPDTDQVIFEVYYQAEVSKESDKVICGYVDCITSSRIYKDTVWEFKCTDSLDKTHFIQLALYNYLIRQNTVSMNKTIYKLFNILSNEIYEIKITDENSDKLVYLLINCKYNRDLLSESENFIEKNMKIYKKYL